MKKYFIIFLVSIIIDFSLCESEEIITLKVNILKNAASVILMTQPEKDSYIPAPSEIIVVFDYDYKPQQEIPAELKNFKIRVFEEQKELPGSSSIIVKSIPKYNEKKYALSFTPTQKINYLKKCKVEITSPGYATYSLTFYTVLEHEVGGEVISKDNKLSLYIPKETVPDIYLEIIPNPDLYIPLSKDTEIVKKDYLYEVVIRYVSNVGNERLKTLKLQKEVTVRLDYEDTDDDSIVDGTYIAEDSLRLFKIYQNKLSQLEDYRLFSKSNKCLGKLSVLSELYNLGLAVLSYNEAGDLSCVINYPNPFVVYKDKILKFSPLPTKFKSQLYIYTLEGELVIKLDNKRPEGGYSSVISWDGKNSAGTVVASGIYIYLIKTEKGESRVGKFTLIK